MYLYGWGFLYYYYLILLGDRIAQRGKLLSLRKGLSYIFIIQSLKTNSCAKEVK